MSRIISIGTAIPRYSTPQNRILGYMQEAYADETASRKLKILFHQSGIGTRNSVIPDFGKEEKGTPLFKGNHSLPNVEDRMLVYKEHAVPLAIDAIENALGKLDISVVNFGFTHLITVTCTGLYAPGIDAEIIERLGLPIDIFRTTVNFMGCNAAFHALKLGDLIVRAEPAAKVLIVCVELCTIHFQPKNNHDNLLSNTIFGDGAAAVIITSDAYGKDNHHCGLTINGFYSLLLNKGKDLMGWNITPVNFEMILNAKVPEFIGDEINNVVLKASSKFNIQPDAISHWAVHPGGKKILDTIKKQMQLADDDLQSSYNVLEQYGNMSSPTILFVLNDLGKRLLQIDETIFAVGFGPGLSIETALLTYEE